MLKQERIGTTAIWTLERPETKNALSYAMLDALRTAAHAAAGDRTLRAVVLTGAGGSFASGGDLRELREAVTREHAEQFRAAGAEVCAMLEALPVPVIAALSGPALGGGAELAVACDLRIADMKARLGFRQVRMGVTTAWGSIPRLLSLVGRSTAARLLYTSLDISAMDAKLVGLVDEVTPDGSCVDVALAWALDVAQGSPSAVAAMKALLRTGAAATDAAASTERRTFVDTWVSEDHGEAMRAYFERRPPKWRDL